VQVGVGADDVDLPVRESTEGVTDGRNAAVEHGAIRDHDEVGAQTLPLGVDQRRQVFAADLFFAFDDELQVDRQATDRLKVGLRRLQVNVRLSLVVGRATGVEVSL